MASPHCPFCEAPLNPAAVEMLLGMTKPSSMKCKKCGKAISAKQLKAQAAGESDDVEEKEETTPPPAKKPAPKAPVKAAAPPPEEAEAEDEENPEPAPAAKPKKKAAPKVVVKKATPGVWGIDLGQCALKAVRLEMVDGQPTATAFDYIEHPKILSQPDADPDQLTREALEQFLARNQIKGDQVVISVPGQSGLARFVKLPPVEEKKIADIVKFEAKQQIPFPLEEVVWDFQKIGAGMVTDGLALETEIGLFAMKRDMVFRALGQFKDVGIEVHIVQMAPLSLVNFVAYDLLAKDNVPPGEEEESSGAKECVVALDIGTDSSNLIITDGARIIWQRPIPLGGNHFTRALTKDLKLTFAKAEHLKRNAAKSPDLKKILASLKTVLNDFVGETQRSLGYFTNTHRDATIKYMMGLGNAFRLPGLQKYLQEKLQLEVRKLSHLERVQGDVLKEPTFAENILSFSVAYGAALQGLKVSRLQTNLLPYEIKVERIVRAKKPWAVAAAAALLLAVAGVTLGRAMDKSAVTGGELTELVKKADAVLSKVGTLNGDFEKEETRAQAGVGTVKRLGAGVEERFNWQLLYQYVNMALPRANGDKLTKQSLSRVRVYQDYYTKDAQTAFNLLEEKRFAKNQTLADPKKIEKDNEFIKKHLIQVNVEGISALYSEDLLSFFKNIVALKVPLRGMKEEDKAAVDALAKEGANEEEIKGKLPAKAWVVEIRGYTYHKDAEEFVENTIMENLVKPENVGNKLSPDMEKQIKERMSFLMLYKIEKVPNPQTGDFKIIRRSELMDLLKPAAAGGGKGEPMGPGPGKDKMPGPGGKEGGEEKPSRDAWKPIGEVATALFGAGLGGSGSGKFVPGVDVNKGANKGEGNPVPGRGDVPRQSRTEFVIYFLWREPLTGELAATDPEAKKD